MAKKIRKDLEERLRTVVKARIKRLREASHDIAPEEEEDDIPVDQPEAEPQQKVGLAPNRPPEGGGDVDPSGEPAPAAPVDSPLEDPMASKEAPPAKDDGQAAIRQQKVRLFFDKLGNNETLMSMLSFNNPLEQAEAIQQFAELVKVPRSQLMPLLMKIKNISQEPDTEV